MESNEKIKWAIDKSHSEIGFKVKHLMVANVRGIFKDYGAEITTINMDFKTAEVNFWINVGSVDTGSADRDNHIKSADFFDAANFEQITFQCKSYEDINKDGIWEVSGDLTIKGITKKILLAVEFGGIYQDPWGNDKAVFNISGIINRTEWGLTWNAPLASGGLLVSEAVHLNFEIQLAKSA